LKGEFLLVQINYFGPRLLGRLSTYFPPFSSLIGTELNVTLQLNTRKVPDKFLPDVSVMKQIITKFAQGIIK
jgi:hypothetical protein